MALINETTPAETILSRDAMLAELLAWANGWLKQSMDFRKNTYEPSWIKWQRASDSTYDPEVAAKKEKWQSKAVWPITASHRENAQAQLFKTEVGPRPPLEFKTRVELMPPMPQMPPGPDGMPVAMPKPPDHGEMIRDLVLREREKARYEIERNKVVEDKTTYGSGFMRAYFDINMDDRVLNEPIYERPFDSPGAALRAVAGQQQIVGYQKVVKSVPIYRGVRLEHIPVWDVFWDPKALKIQGSGLPIAIRYHTTLGDIVKGVGAGYNIPESVLKLKDASPDEDTPEDKQQVEADRGIAQSDVPRPNYAKILRCYEMEARLPKKWVLIDGEPIDDPEKLIPAVIRFHASAVISVRVSSAYDGEPEVYKDDYIPVSGQFIGRGIPEMLKDVQLVSSETINQRLDAGAIAIRQRFAVIEKALVDPKDIDEDRNVVRLKAPGGMALTDVKQVMGRLDMGTVSQAAFVEPQEWERIAQERTSITRMTLGTAGQVKDANETLGGQQLLLQATGDKLAFIGMLSEFGFQRDLNLKIFSLIYQNYEPQDYVDALGPEKASQLVLMTPEEIAQKFNYLPKGIFEMSNKAMRQARIADMTARYGTLPFWNILGAAKAEIAAVDEDEAQFILPESEAMQITMKAQMMAQGMAQQVLAQRDQEELAAKAEKGAKMENK